MDPRPSTGGAARDARRDARHDDLHDLYLDALMDDDFTAASLVQSALGEAAG